MSKYVSKSQIIGEKGVSAFYNYCTRHSPFIIFREESKNDFGIDGEVEFTYTDDNKRIVASGEIIKIQIKSTETGSYIYNETDSAFDFKASSSDIDYWNNHKVDVILIIYLVSEEKLYARKITESDYIQAISSKNIILTFDKKDNLLIDGDNKFQTVYSSLFKSRINYDIVEILYTNVLKFNKLPHLIYAYKSKIFSTKEIYSLKLISYPIFVNYSGIIYSFNTLENYPDFIKEVVEEKKYETFNFKKFLNDKQTKNWGIELINRYFKEHCSEKDIWFNKDYNRFYFGKKSNTIIDAEKKKNFEKNVFRIERYRTKKNIQSKREVVSWYNYYDKTSFYRHFAFEIGYFSDEQSLYISITPKYLFTEDGRKVLEDRKKISKYTTFLTSREFNQQVLNQIYFIKEFLSHKGVFTIANYGNCTISLSDLIQIKVPFGITSASLTKSVKKNITNNPVQGNLFPDL